MLFLSKIRSRKSFLGLDIGSYSLKLAEATLKGSQVIITGFSQIRLPKGVVADGLVKNDEIFLKNLNILLENLKTRSRNLNIGLYAYTALYDRIPISLREGIDLSVAVREEIESLIPFDINEVYYDYFPLIKDDKYEIIFAVSKREYIDKILNIFSKINLNVNSIDIDVFSISNLLEYLYGPSSRMVIDIGNSKTLIIFIDKDGPLFSREISLGLSSIAEHISRKLELSFEEAERIKIEVPSDNRKDVIIKIYKEFFSSLVKELENSLSIFKAKYYYNPEEIFVIGGGALIPGIHEFLQDSLKAPIRDLNISNKIKFCDDFDRDYILELNKIGVFAVSQAVKEFLA